MGITATITDTLFPPSCMGCGKANTWLCDACSQALLIKSIPECVVCGKYSNRYLTHKNCQTEFPVTKVLTCWKYNTLAKKIMKTFKYNFRYGITTRIIELAMPQLQTHFHMSDQNTILIPIPSHAKRIRHRGFNQSFILAQGISKELNLQVANPLIKTVHTDHQSHKSRAERLQQKKDIYTLKPNLSILLEGKDLVIVDDVCTTGSTIRATAQKLLKAKPRSITALTLFRASRTSQT